MAWGGVTGIPAGRSKLRFMRISSVLTRPRRHDLSTPAPTIPIIQYFLLFIATIDWTKLQDRQILFGRRVRL